MTVILLATLPLSQIVSVLSHAGLSDETEVKRTLKSSGTSKAEIRLVKLGAHIIPRLPPVALIYPTWPGLLAFQNEARNFWLYVLAAFGGPRRRPFHSSCPSLLLLVNVLVSWPYRLPKIRLEAVLQPDRHAATKSGKSLGYLTVNCRADGFRAEADAGLFLHLSSVFTTHVTALGLLASAVPMNRVLPDDVTASSPNTTDPTNEEGGSSSDSPRNASPERTKSVSFMPVLPAEAKIHIWIAAGSARLFEATTVKGYIDAEGLPRSDRSSALVDIHLPSVEVAGNWFSPHSSAWTAVGRSDDMAARYSSRLYTTVNIAWQRLEVTPLAFTVLRQLGPHWPDLREHTTARRIVLTRSTKLRHALLRGTDPLTFAAQVQPGSDTDESVSDTDTGSIASGVSMSAATPQPRHGSHREEGLLAKVERMHTQAHIKLYPVQINVGWNAKQAGGSPVLSLGTAGPITAFISSGPVVGKEGIVALQSVSIAIPNAFVALHHARGMSAKEAETPGLSEVPLLSFRDDASQETTIDSEALACANTGRNSAIMLGQALQRPGPLPDSCDEAIRQLYARRLEREQEVSEWKAQTGYYQGTRRHQNREPGWVETSVAGAILGTTVLLSRLQDRSEGSSDPTIMMVGKVREITGTLNGGALRMLLRFKEEWTTKLDSALKMFDVVELPPAVGEVGAEAEYVDPLSTGDASGMGAGAGAGMTGPGGSSAVGGAVPSLGIRGVQGGMEPPRSPPLPTSDPSVVMHDEDVTDTMTTPKLAERQGRSSRHGRVQLKRSRTSFLLLASVDTMEALLDFQAVDSTSLRLSADDLLYHGKDEVSLLPFLPRHKPVIHTFQLQSAAAFSRDIELSLELSKLRFQTTIDFFYNPRARAGLWREELHGAVGLMERCGKEGLQHLAIQLEALRLIVIRPASAPVSLLTASKSREFLANVTLKELGIKATEEIRKDLNGVIGAIRLRLKAVRCKVTATLASVLLERAVSILNYIQLENDAAQRSFFGDSSGGAEALPSPSASPRSSSISPLARLRASRTLSKKEQLLATIRALKVALFPHTVRCITRWSGHRVRVIGNIDSVRLQAYRDTLDDEEWAEVGFDTIVVRAEHNKLPESPMDLITSKGMALAKSKAKYHRDKRSSWPLLDTRLFVRVASTYVHRVIQKRGPFGHAAAMGRDDSQVCVVLTVPRMSIEMNGTVEDAHTMKRLQVLDKAIFNQSSGSRGGGGGGGGGSSPAGIQHDTAREIRLRAQRASARVPWLFVFTFKTDFEGSVVVSPDATDYAFFTSAQGLLHEYVARAKQPLGMLRRLPAEQAAKALPIAPLQDQFEFVINTAAENPFLFSPSFSVIGNMPLPKLGSIKQLRTSIPKALFASFVLPSAEIANFTQRILTAFQKLLAIGAITKREAAEIIHAAQEVLVSEGMRSSSSSAGRGVAGNRRRLPK